MQSSIIKIGSNFFKKSKEVTIKNLIDSTEISKKTVIKILGKLISVNLLRKKTGKPNFYYIQQTMLSELFFKTCSDIENLFAENKKENILSIQEIITNLKNDNSVLILIYYGSSAKGTNDKLSDVDLLAVTRDKISRGEILTKYSMKKLDLSVYSKTGFLQFIKTYPDFVNNIAKAQVLKGEEILKVIIQ